MKAYDEFIIVVKKYESDMDTINEIFAEYSDNADDIKETISVMNTGSNDMSIQAKMQQPQKVLHFSLENVFYFNPFAIVVL